MNAIAIPMPRTQGYVPIMSIGRGGMGRIDLAVSVGLPGAEKLVVLKRLREPNDDSEESRRLLGWEARLSARLMHPNVAATLGLDTLSGELVLVLEYLEGATLSTLVRACAERGERIPRPILLRIVRDALAGLGYAHGLVDYDGSPLGIVHRDVSPSNLLVTTEGITKVLDFGIAKSAGSTCLTPLGYVKGKLGYMAPEQLLGRAVDARADLYATGVVLYEGLTRERFCVSEDLDACLARRLDSDAPDLHSVAPDVPRSLEDIVRTCLARDPRDRWQTASVLRSALDSHVAMHGDDASTQDVAQFVADLCGESLRARRAYLQDRFAQLTGPSTLTTRVAPRTERIVRDSTSPFVVDVTRMTPPTSAAPPLVATPSTPAPIRFLRASLPIAAAILGATLSFSATEIRARLGASRVGPTAPRTPNAVEIVGAGLANTRARSRVERPIRDEPDGAHPKSAPSKSRVVTTGAHASSVPPPPDDASAGAVPPSPPPSEPPGFATIDSYPWARVRVDGADVGVTPVVRLALPPGAHTVVLENPDKGRNELTVHVRSGDAAVERWRW